MHALQVVQYLTIDYGLEFCDFYGARCAKHQVESIKVTRLARVPAKVEMSWMPFRLPLKTVMADAAVARHQQQQRATPE